MPNEITLSIVVPTYNEEDNIGRLLETAHRVLSEAGITHELIVVDDASRDQTRPRVTELQTAIPNLRLIRRDNERGLASAMVHGYNSAAGEFLGAMDADLAHDPIHLPDMIKRLINDEADLVIGSRYVAGASFTGKPLVNKITSLVGQALVKLLLGLPVKDTSNNYRVFRRTLWDKIKNRLHPDGNIMLTEIVYRAFQNHARIAEIPIDYRERQTGKSKLHITLEVARFFKNIYKIKHG